MIWFVIYMTLGSGGFMWATLELEPAWKPWKKTIVTLWMALTWPFAIMTMALVWFFTGKWGE